MVFVLIGLCTLFSILTLKEQTPDSGKAAAQIANNIDDGFSKNDLIITVGAFNKPSALFAQQLSELLANKGFSNTQTIVGIPRDLRLALDEIQQKGERIC